MYITEKTAKLWLFQAVFFFKIAIASASKIIRLMPFFSVLCITFSKKNKIHNPYLYLACSLRFADRMVKIQYFFQTTTYIQKKKETEHGIQGNGLHKSDTYTIQLKWLHSSIRWLRYDSPIHKSICQNLHGLQL